MTAIEEFVSALYGAGWPSAAAFSNDFSLGELLGTTQDTMPLAVEYIDGTVEEWWLWAGSVDFQRTHEIAQASPLPMWTPLAVEPTEGGAVAPLDYVLEFVAERTEVLTQEGQQFFPILVDWHNCLYGIRRANPTDPWRLWHLDREDAYWRAPTPGRERDSTKAPLFEDWLGRLTDGLRSGNLQTNEDGGVDLADPPSDREDHRYWYPWGDW